MPIWKCISAVLLSIALTACADAPSSASVEKSVVANSDFIPKPYVQVQHPEWTRDAVIYQINTRQFTAEGTFRAAQGHLPRLEALGIDILWLMPVHPIGEAKRKGSLGSPYSVRDYRGVNPEFGSVEDLKAFVDEAHERGMYVILDWVANHSSWDNPLLDSHPEWYDRGADGEMRHTPWTDWTDIVDLDYAQPGLRKYMTEVMEYWVRDVGVDGFRCDVAGFVPLDFWETLRTRLEAIKPVFMLAEWESRDMHAHAFDATYAWKWKEAVQAAVRDKSAGPINGFFYEHQNTWPEDAYRMHYTSNHDQNSWDGTARDIYGPGLETAIVFSFTSESIPLIYNGQEAGLDKKLAFFEKDEIEWRDDPLNDLFKRLIDVKTGTKALWNGNAGAPLVPVTNSNADKVLSFTRTGEDDAVFVVLNFSDEALSLTVDGLRESSDWTDVFSGATRTISTETPLTLPAHGHLVFRRQITR